LRMCTLSPMCMSMSMPRNEYPPLILIACLVLNFTPPCPSVQVGT